MTWLREWLAVLWQPRDAAVLREAYRTTFASGMGRAVLTDLLDSTYCTIYEGTDVLAMAYHNGRRSVIHEILENLDRVEHPDKYETRVETPTEAGNGLHP